MDMAELTSEVDVPRDVAVVSMWSVTGSSGTGNGMTAASRAGVVGVVTGSGDMGLNTMSPSLLLSPALTSSMSAVSAK